MSQCSLRSRPMELFTVDISESGIAKDSMSLLNILLKDRTTKRNIKWASPSYKGMGKPFHAEREIRAALITGKYGTIIQPRVEKSKQKQELRTKKRAEVFTPAWLVDKQVRMVEQETGPMDFNSYIRRKWLELACGEGPYMVTRYDSTTGEMIPISERVGFLDRKLQRIMSYIDGETEFIDYCIAAYETSYGYEFQGDSLLLARENLLLTFCEYYQHKFSCKPDIKTTKKLAQIISYNVIQMNGITLETPYSVINDALVPMDIFNQNAKLEVGKHRAAAIKDWHRNEMITIESISKGDETMKFDVVIGNPPYQEEKQGTSDKPIYNYMMDTAETISDRVCLITPARFLFNAGKTPAVWNRKKLSDDHFKVLYYQQNSAKVFPNTDIKGGVAITYRDNNKYFGAIDTFVAYKELNSILHKVWDSNDQRSISDWVFAPESYKLTSVLHEEFPDVATRLSKGHEFDVTTNIFDKLPEVFVDTPDKSIDSSQYIRFEGRSNNSRATKWVLKKYIHGPKNLYYYKIILPKSNGSGALGEVLSTPLIGEPLIGEPLIGHTQTFISIGAFATREEAEACFKYIKSKFARVMLGILKITQHNAPATWRKVPLQDFTPQSDIDWSQSVADIDKQLYAKYKLSQEEIDFIEEKVRAMD